MIFFAVAVALMETGNNILYEHNGSDVSLSLWYKWALMGPRPIDTMWIVEGRGYFDIKCEQTFTRV